MFLDNHENSCECERVSSLAFFKNTHLTPEGFNMGFFWFCFSCNYVLTETPIHFGLNLCEYQIRAPDLKFL